MPDHIEWPVGRGRWHRFRYIATSADAALENLREAHPQAWQTLARRGAQAFMAGVMLARAERIRRVAASVEDALEQLQDMWRDLGGPTDECSEAATSRLLATSLGALRVREQDLRRSAGARRAARISAPMKAKIGGKDLSIADDVLANAVADLEWVTGLDLVQLSIAMTVESALATNPKQAADEERDRRKQWDMRLRRARRGLRSRASDAVVAP